MKKKENSSVNIVSKTSVLKCKNCGGDMIYSPKFGALYCPYCDSKVNLPHYNVIKRIYELEKTNGGVQENTTLYKCPNCDAEIELGRFEDAGVCSCCGAANLVKTENLNGIAPDTILPFLTKKEDAYAAGQKFIKKKLFAPSKLKKEFKVDNFKGLYIPSFAFDAQTNSSYEARIGDKKEREVERNGQKTTETYIEWRVVSGKYNADFADLMIEATSTVNRKEFCNILPFDVENVEKYDYRYVAGYSSERHSKSLSDGCSEAQGKMKEKIRRGILDNYSYDELDYIHVYTTFKNVKFRYIMVPIWICAYKFKQKIYKYIVNGRTNKAFGKTPVSPLKVALLVGGILCVVTAIVLLVLHDYGVI